MAQDNPKLTGKVGEAFFAQLPEYSADRELKKTMAALLAEATGERFATDSFDLVKLDGDTVIGVLEVKTLTQDPRKAWWDYGTRTLRTMDAAVAEGYDAEWGILSIPGVEAPRSVQGIAPLLKLLGTSPDTVHKIVSHQRFMETHEQRHSKIHVHALPAWDTY